MVPNGDSRLATRDKRVNDSPVDSDACACGACTVLLKSVPRDFCSVLERLAREGRERHTRPDDGISSFDRLKAESADCRVSCGAIRYSMDAPLSRITFSRVCGIERPASFS